MSKCLKFCKIQKGTQTKALGERNWFASRIFLANEKWDFDNQISQKHVNLPQILQNTNRYSNESSQRKKLICLNGLSDKWKMTFWQPNKSRTCQNASNFAKCKLVIVENSPLLNSIEILAYQPDHFIYVYRYFVLYCLPHNLANTHGSQSDPRYVNVHTLSAVYMPAQKSAQ